MKCRFCNSRDEDVNGLNPIRYSVRHYAHPDCLLGAKGPSVLRDLSLTDLRNFPYFALVRNNALGAMKFEWDRRGQEEFKTMTTAEKEELGFASL